MCCDESVKDIGFLLSKRENTSYQQYPPSPIKFIFSIFQRRNSY